MQTRPDTFTQPEQSEGEWVQGAAAASKTSFSFVILKPRTWRRGGSVRTSAIIILVVIIIIFLNLFFFLKFSSFYAAIKLLVSTRIK